MAEAVAIKVLIGLKPNGHADYPDWTTLPLAAGGKDRVEQEALVRAQQIRSWAYDKSSGHEDDTPDSPKGQQWGMLLVTQQYADEAVALWPGRVTVMTEAEAEDFWNNKAHAHMAAQRIDADYLQGLLAERQLRVALGLNTTDVDARAAKALDPNDASPGVRAMKDKTWSAFKSAAKVTIKAVVAEGI